MNDILDAIYDSGAPISKEARAIVEGRRRDRANPEQPRTMTDETKPDPDGPRWFRVKYGRVFHAETDDRPVGYMARGRGVCGDYPRGPVKFIASEPLYIILRKCQRCQRRIDAAKRKAADNGVL